MITTTSLIYILRPIIGGVIGYVTNDIAIRMLFRPRRAKYLFGHQLPFTPGLIPKEKPRIAASIGRAISENLMNCDVIERTLLSDEMTGKISAAIDSFVNTQSRNNETVEQFIGHYLPDDDLAAMRANISADLSQQIHTALAGAGLGSRIARMATEHVIAKVRSGVMGMFGADQFISLIAAPAENLLAKNIDEMLRNRSQEMVSTLIDDQIGEFLSKPVSALIAGHTEQIARAKTTLLSLYTTIVREQLHKILAAVDISRIVETRINEMDVVESERLILTVMRKELRAIVWLGALLGFIMGCINLLF